MKCSSSLAFATGFAVAAPLLSTTPRLHALDYERDVQPIFEKKCYDCHSSEADKVKGGLRLDDEEHFFKRFAKNDIVIPGDWDASYLFVTITRPHDAKEAMPPKGKGDPLTPEEIMTVANWIHEGAKVGREKGEAGSDDFKPEDFIKFKDGVMLTEGAIASQPSSDDAAGDEKTTMKTGTPSPTLREWTNREGAKIKAILKGVEGRNAVLQLENGQVTATRWKNYPTKAARQSTGSQQLPDRPAFLQDVARPARVIVERERRINPQMAVDHGENTLRCVRRPGDRSAVAI